MLKGKVAAVEEELPATAELAFVAGEVAQTGDASPSGEATDVAPDAVAEPAAPDASGSSDEVPGKKDAKKPDKRSDKPDKKDDKQPSMELDADAEVDPVLLAKEFSGLLQVESGDDEATS